MIKVGGRAGHAVVATGSRDLDCYPNILIGGFYS